MNAETISSMLCRCPHRESLSQTVRKRGKKNTHTHKENFRFLSSMKIIWRLLRVRVFALLVNSFAEASASLSSSSSNLQFEEAPNLKDRT